MIKITEAPGDQTIIEFGKLLRRDKAAKFQLLTWSVEDLGDGKISQPKVDVAREGPIPRKGRLYVKLPEGTRCIVMAGGAQTGVVTTREHSLMTPFHLEIDATKWAAHPQVNGVPVIGK